MSSDVFSVLDPKTLGLSVIFLISSIVLWRKLNAERDARDKDRREHHALMRHLYDQNLEERRAQTEAALLHVRALEALKAAIERGLTRSTGPS